MNGGDDNKNGHDREQVAQGAVILRRHRGGLPRGYFRSEPGKEARPKPKRHPYRDKRQQRDRLPLRRPDLIGHRKHFENLVVGVDRKRDQGHDDGHAHPVDGRRRLTALAPRIAADDRVQRKHERQNACVMVLPGEAEGERKQDNEHGRPSRALSRGFPRGWNCLSICACAHLSKLRLWTYVDYSCPRPPGVHPAMPFARIAARCLRQFNHI